MSLKEKVALAKNDKKKIIWLLGAAMVVIILLLFIDGGGEETGKEPVVPAVSASENYDRSRDLEAVLKKIEGVGDVSVAIEYEGTSYKEYAYNEEVSERITNGDSGSSETTTTKEMVMVNGDEAPVIIEERYPVIKGVVIVANGADDANVRKNLLDTATTFLDIGANRVEICTGEVTP